MFARVYSLFFLLVSIPFMVAATAVPRNGGSTVNQCNVGTVACCNTVQQAEEFNNGFGGFLGITAPVTSQIGLGCSPIGVGALQSGSDCNASPVCCENNDFNGLVNVGCNSINA